jgi:predicted O-methyltransferase YrrM|tara:strand:- start:58 stop:645 length:588 start_codon:yes stop_codon:yes gene_type:complete
MNLNHLSFPDIGWGYMPPTEQVFAAFKFAQETYNPKSVLEIGFHIGHSTTYQLEIYPDAKIVGVSPDNEVIGKPGDSIDPQVRRDMVNTLNEKYINRFTWVPGRTKDVKHRLVDEYVFDFALVDGNHAEAAALYDMEVIYELAIPNLLIDNWDQRQVKSAVLKQGKYELVKEFNYDQTFKGKTQTNQMGLLTLKR